MNEGLEKPRGSSKHLQTIAGTRGPGVRIKIREAAMKRLSCLGILLAIVACCSEKSSLVETRMEDGVEAVLNHLEPYRLKGMPTRLSVERKFSIDFERQDLAELGISEILGFDVDSTGHIFCLCDAAIFKFDPKGEFLLKFGRKGEGPGEFSYPVRCAVSERDEFWVFDYAKYKFILYEQSGEFIRETGLNVLGDLWGMGEVYYLDETTTLQMVAPLDPDEATPAFQLIVQNTEAGRRRTLPDRLEGEDPFNSPRFNLFHHRLLYQVARRNIFVTSQQNSQFEINIYDVAGMPQKRIRKEYRKIRLREEYKTRRMEWFKKHPLSRKHKMQGYFPDFYPPIQDFFVDSEGRIFVETYEEADNPDAVTVDIFNPDGVYLIRTSLVKSQSKRFKHGRLYALQEKDSGFQELNVSALSWD
jgi:hypothetical protein